MLLTLLVFRDDIPDGGASHLAQTVKCLKEKKKTILIECLLPDFAGNVDSVQLMAR